MYENVVRASMQRAIDVLSSDMSSIRTGRATPGLVDGLSVSVYGGTQKLTLRELASITCPDTQMIIIDPWDKSIIGDIKQGILAANVGFNPSISSKGGPASGGDGEVLRIVLPPMTSEDREKYVKLLSGKLENARVVVRQVRGDTMHSIKKAFEEKTTSEDEKFAHEKKLQEVTDEYVQKIDQMGEKKKLELLQI